MQSQQPHLPSYQAPDYPRAIDWRVLGRLALIAAIAVPAVAMAQGTDATSAVCSLLGQVEKVLTAVSVVVVTIAIIFAGYQIAFAHKRITEVAPILIGGILIGAAGQIASTLLSSYSSSTSGCQAPTSSITPDIILTQIASIAHSVSGYLA
jgi:type IV secretion system protein VirB2